MTIKGTPIPKPIANALLFDLHSFAYRLKPYLHLEHVESSFASIVQLWVHPLIPQSTKSMHYPFLVALNPYLQEVQNTAFAAISTVIISSKVSFFFICSSKTIFSD